MARTFTHLALEERALNVLMNKQGFGSRRIGEHLDLDPEAILRELKRNCGTTNG